MASKGAGSFAEDTMKVVVVGKGGREHALAAKLLESDIVKELWVCPGNPGMQKMGIQCKTDVETPEAIATFCVENKISLVVVGPEAAILSNLKVNLERQGIACFAPSKEVAQLESSKLFCKGILHDAEVPTAKCVVSYSEEEALETLSQHDFSEPIVIKADGLAQGKGVSVCESLSKAQEAVRTLGRQYGFPLLLEECLLGQELSAFALCDGEDFVLLGTACDYKRISSEVFSANTGGMGAYSPCDFISTQDETEIKNIFAKTLSCLKRKKLSYQGFLFAGLMKTSRGLFVLEYNVRMGDPETQALLPRIRSDLGKLLVSAVTHELKGQTCELSSQWSVHVVATSKGYPQANMDLGHSISLPSWDGLSTRLYFSGIKELNQTLVNSGGRVLGVTALGENKESARKNAYTDIRKISFNGMYMREDIAE
ncbi:phosphoribosylamine--glycine ligase [Bdellovibrio bacteriovorus]|uniref:phosphoribosylamine--glycine ligase n=1 Tax=Bdellovibrio bacteriovorus TaxID=959 RepID=UPI0035A706DB